MGPDYDEPLRSGIVALVKPAESRIELKVGLLIVVCLGLLVGFLFLLGGWRRGETATLTVDFDTSGGLKIGAPVKIAGMDAGRVESIAFLGGQIDKEVNRQVWVRVTLTVAPDMRQTLRKDAGFYITTQGLLGEKYVEIDPGRQDGPLPDSVASGMPPPRLEILAAQVGKVLEQVNGLLSDNRETITETIRNVRDTVLIAKTTLEEARVFIRAAGQTLTVVEGKGVRLLDVATTALEEYTPGKGETGNNIRAAVRSGAGVLERVESVIGDGAEMRAIVTETQGAVGDARQLLKNADHQIAGVSAKVQGVLATADATIQDGRAQVLGAIGKVDSVIDDVKQIALQIRRGEGTVGALLMDRELFDDARELMKDIKRHPWKVLWKE